MWWCQFAIKFSGGNKRKVFCSHITKNEEGIGIIETCQYCHIRVYTDKFNKILSILEKEI